MSNEVIISCPTIRKELERAVDDAAFSGRVVYLPARLHSDPGELRKYLQETIDKSEGVERILLCVSGCGGGTVGLRATAAQLVIPRCRDCIDLLLSDGESDGYPERERDACFVTESWADYMRQSDIDLESMVEKYGREEGESALRRIYRTINKFNIVDTGTYDVKKVREYIEPLVEVLDCSLKIVRGPCGILKKLVSGRPDKNLLVVSKGETVKPEDFSCSS